LGEHLHVGQAGRKDFKLTEVGQQEARLAGLNVFLGATLFKRGQRANGTILGLGFFPTISPGVKECLPR